MTPSTQAAPSCPDCFRLKARTADDCRLGYCPKWYAIRDPDAQRDCDQIANRIKSAYESKRAAPVQRAVIGVDEAPLVQPCPHCDKPVAMGKDQRLRKYDFGAPPHRGRTMNATRLLAALLYSSAMLALGAAGAIACLDPRRIGLVQRCESSAESYEPTPGGGTISHMGPMRCTWVVPLQRR